MFLSSNIYNNDFIIRMKMLSILVLSVSFNGVLYLVYSVGYPVFLYLLSKDMIIEIIYVQREQTLYIYHSILMLHHCARIMYFIQQIMIHSKYQT